MTSFHQRFLGKIYSVLFYLAVEDLSEENVVYMSSLRLPLLDFLVSSVQFSVNKEVTLRYTLVFSMRPQN